MTAQTVPRWGKFELQLNSSNSYTSPFHEVKLSATFAAPSGSMTTVDGFWDGGNVWRIRFRPDEQGDWSYITRCDPIEDAGLHEQEGRFICGESAGYTVFDRHGAIQVSPNRRYFIHADGTPFLWMGDTAWNGPLRADDLSWAHYLEVRRQQQFNVVLWVATHWRAAAHGDEYGELAFTGRERIAISPSFFQRLDKRVAAINQAGFLSVPVLLWAHKGANETATRLNPGFDLPEDEAILLARYMVARWGADHCAWILAGDGNYKDEVTERWKRIGRAVFDNRQHAPVTVHPISIQWTQAQFDDEAWFDFIGYQSGHGDSNEYISWLVEGPPAQPWQQGKPHPIVNLEPPYENHIAYHSRKPFDADMTRKRLYWSLLVSPTAGVTYGGHGVWGWDDGTKPPEDHEGTGIPLPWQAALLMPAAEQIPHLVNLFNAFAWWDLQPTPEILIEQPGILDKERFVTAARASKSGKIVIYMPHGSTIQLHPAHLAADFVATWFDPRTGEQYPAPGELTGSSWTVTAPNSLDWVLLVFTKTQERLSDKE